MMIKKFSSSFLILLLILSGHSAEAVDLSVRAQNATSTALYAEAGQGSSKIKVIGNKDTKRYHLPGMPYYHKVKAYHRIYFDSEQQAIDHGYYKAGTEKKINIQKPVFEDKTVIKEMPPKHKSIQREYVQKSSPIEYAKVFNYKIILAFILFAVFFALPFFPAISEVIRKQDSNPLFISMDYNKDPRYFCKSFKKIIKIAVAGLTGDHQIREVILSKKEEIQITKSLHVTTGEQMEMLLYVQGDMVSDANVLFNKEIYVSGNAHIGPGNILHVLAAEGNMTIADGTEFERWLDAEGDLKIGSQCHLGISASCGGRLDIADGCVFRRLYGMPVTTGTIQSVDNMKGLSVEPLPQPGSSFVRKTDKVVAEGSVLNGNIVFLKDVIIGRNSIVNGSVKCYGDIRLEDNVKIYGNIFADGKINVGRKAIIIGHIFSQNSILISEHSIISKPGVIKSVLGKKSVRLAPDVTIYGYISTEGRGRVI